MGGNPSQRLRHEGIVLFSGLVIVGENDDIGTFEVLAVFIPLLQAAWRCCGPGTPVRSGCPTKRWVGRFAGLLGCFLALSP